MHKNKFAIAIKIVALSIAFFLMGFLVFQSASTEEVDFDDLNDQVINVLNSTPHIANETNGDYIFYIPSEYTYIMDGNTVILENSSAVFTMYMGYNTKVDSEFIDAINPSKPMVYEYVEETEEEIYYFCIWENDDFTYNVLMGTNDMYIEGIVHKNKVEKYIIEIATILNSIQEIDKKEEIDMNGAKNGN